MDLAPRENGTALQVRNPGFAMDYDLSANGGGDFFVRFIYIFEFQIKRQRIKKSRHWYRHISMYSYLYLIFPYLLQIYRKYKIAMKIRKRTEQRNQSKSTIFNRKKSIRGPTSTRGPPP